MTLELKKVVPVELRTAGLNEKWLQDRIADDPGLLGLGDLEIASREHRQPIGGRIDFLMRDTEGETYYEVEVMLGTLDESHIIRTIEYWDIERQRRPNYEHRAVIVAESITSRFFNILRLLNRSVPMIAVQLSAFRINDNEIVLHPVTVLNVPEAINDELPVDVVEQADRAYWEKKDRPESLAIMDKIVTALKAEGSDPRVTYNRGHIALGTTAYNFCWFYPRKIGCHIEVRLRTDTRDNELSQLQSQGIDASPRHSDNLTFSVTNSAAQSHMSELLGLLKRAEQWSRER